MNTRIFKIISITIFTLLCLGLITGLICLTVFGCNGNILMNFTSKKLSPNMLTKKFNMLSQDCLFVEVITNELCVETSFDQKVVENGVVISSSTETLRKYEPGDEFCLSVKNTNTAYSCNENSTAVLITPTLFNSNNRLNNDCIIILLGIFAMCGILVILFSVVYDPILNILSEKFKHKQQKPEKQNEEVEIEMDKTQTKQPEPVKLLELVEPLEQIEPVRQPKQVEQPKQIEPVRQPKQVEQPKQIEPVRQIDSKVIPASQVEQPEQEHIEIETDEDSADFSEPIEEF